MERGRGGEGWERAHLSSWPDVGDVLFGADVGGIPLGADVGGIPLGADVGGIRLGADLGGILLGADLCGVAQSSLTKQQRGKNVNRQQP